MLPDGVTLYFIRHGETDWNKVQRYQGQTDIPLNDTGRAQAKRNGSILRELHGPALAGFDFVASPLSRTRETMEIVRRELGFMPHDFRHDERLKESHFGHWEGQLQDELHTVDPDGFAARSKDAWSWQPDGGESYSALSDRVGTWLATVARDAVVVAHGGVSRALRGLVLDMPTSEVPFLAVPQDQVLVVRAGAISWL